MIQENKKLFFILFGIELILNFIMLIFYFNSTGEINFSEFLNFYLPDFLLLNILGFLFAILFIRSSWRGDKVSKFQLSGNVLKSISKKHQIIYYGLMRSMLLSLTISAGLPYTGVEQIKSTTSKSEIIFCVDISRSMNARDMNSSSRLEVSKRLLSNLTQQLDGEKIALCVFAAEAIRQVESTRDYKYFQTILKNVDTDLISNQGTNIWKALLCAEEMFSMKNASQTIVMITDAENHDSISVDILNQLQKNGIGTIYVGVGSEDGSWIMANEGEYVTDNNGQRVVSKMNSKMIKELARKSKGSSLIIRDEFPDSNILLTEINQFKKKNKGNLELVGKNLIHTWFIWIALLCFTLFLSFSWWIKK